MVSCFKARISPSSISAPRDDAVIDSPARADAPPTTARTAAHAGPSDEDRPPGDSAPGGAAGDRGAVQAAGAVQARWALAGFALEELARRQREHGGPYARMDGTRIAVVGFDLGADTALALAGAQLLVVLSANMHPYTDYHLTYAKARAMENGLPLALSNWVGDGPRLSFLGRSCIVSGIES